MMDNIKISIIVPIYKVETYIYQCIESILNQTYSNLEILLIDDGSPDHCGQICDEFAQKDSRIRVFHIENSGQSHARNVGMEAATGDYIGFVDGDDRIQQEMYEKLLYTALEEDADIVECNFHGRKQELPDHLEDGIKISMTGKKAIRRQLDGRIPSRYPSTSVWSKLFKRSIIMNLRMPDGRIHEEYAFLCEAFLNTQKYIYINQCLYERTLREDSTTAEKFSARTLDKIYVYQLRNQLLAEKRETDLLRFSKEQEFELLLYTAAQAQQSGMEQERIIVENIIDNQKKDILHSKLQLKKKLLYYIYFVNKNIYYRLKRDKENKKVYKL